MAVDSEPEGRLPSLWQGNRRLSGGGPGRRLPVPPGAEVLLGLLPVPTAVRRRARAGRPVPARDEARDPVTAPTDRLAAALRGSELAPLAEKVFAGERLTFEDGVRLSRTRDFLGLGRLANHVREARHANVAYYNVNRYLNPTNLCWVDCALCAWAKKVNEPGGYELAIDECVAEAGRGYSEAVTEFHIVGGLHPTWPYEYYTGLLRALKDAFPGVHLKAFTMVELDWIAHVGGKMVAEAIADLKEAGMDSCPGGGAEIFERRVRDVICRNKISGERWLEIARECHAQGVRTNATMLYGHVETVEDRVDHLLRLRDLQDQTGGFTGLIPL